MPKMIQRLYVQSLMASLQTPKPAASLNSRKFFDSIKGNLQTASMAQTIVCSDSGVSHIPLSSQPISHLLSSRKDNILLKGQMISVGVNTLCADIISLATDPSHLLSITAPAVNASLMSQGEVQADISVLYDPSAKTQADVAEGTKSITTKSNIYNNKVFWCSSLSPSNIKGENSEVKGEKISLMMLTEKIRSRRASKSTPRKLDFLIILFVKQSHTVVKEVSIKIRHINFEMVGHQLIFLLPGSCVTFFLTGSGSALIGTTSPSHNICIYDMRNLLFYDMRNLPYFHPLVLLNKLCRFKKRTSC